MHLSNKNILITGTRSGLGKYLHEMLPGSIGLNRENSNEVISNLSKNGINTIVHCACNKNQNEYYQQYIDNLKFTETLCSIPHKKFIFISSIDVYSDKQNTYSVVKNICEKLVENLSNKPVVLRLSALIGAGMKKNNVLKVLLDEKPSLSLTKDSTYSLVSYSHVLKVIKGCIKNNIHGTYDVVAKKEITIDGISKYCKKEAVVFGNYKYISKVTSGGVIEKKLNLLQKTSAEVLKDFLNEQQV